MANKKFSEFELKTTTSNVSHVVGYDGVENVRITPANFLDTTGGPYLPLAGGTMTGTNGVVFPDNFYLNLGTSSDFEIYHDGNNSYLKDQGTGELILASNGTGIKLEKTSGEKMIHALTDGAVELYYDSVKKFETTLLGATVTGDLLVTGTITGTGGSFLPLAGGTLTGDLFSTQSNTDAVPTDNLSGNEIINIANENNSGVYSALKFRTRTSGAAQSIIGLRMDSVYTDAKFFVRLRNAGLSSSEVFSVGNTGATFAGDVYVGNSKVLRFPTLNGSLGNATIDFDSGSAFTLTSNSSNASMVFKTSSAERMRLDKDGNLGLGTTTPNAPLEINGNTRITRVNSPGTYQQIEVTDILTTFNGQDTDGYMHYAFNSNDSTRLYINGSTGNVGIGTTSPVRNISVFGASSATMSFQTSTSGSSLTDGLFIGNDASLTYFYNYEATPIAFATSGSERMRLDSDGNLLVGRTSKTSTSTNGSAYILGDIASGGVNDYAQVFVEHSSVVNHGIIIKELASSGIAMGFLNSSGATVGRITTTATATGYATSSDYRLKEDLQDFKGLDLVSKIPVYDYKWKAEDSRSYGVMAHELQEVLPQAVSGDKDAEEMQGVDYSKIVPLLVKSIQELSAKLESLECQCKKK